MIGSGCGSGNSPIAPENVSIEESMTATSTGRLNGQVEKIEGVAITVRVMQNGREIASTEADADGNYLFDKIQSGTYTVEITAKGHETATLAVQVSANQVTSFDKVALKALGNPVAHVRGLLFDHATKQALKDVLVQLIDNQGNTLEALTTATGGFAFENVPAEQRFTLKVNLADYEKQEIKIGPVLAGETAKLEIELVPIKLEKLPLGDGLTIGTEAPNFSLPDGDGKVHSLADYVGKKKVVLIFYRGSW